MKRRGFVRKTGYFTATVIISLAAVAAGSGLPPEVADRLENAISFDEDIARGAIAWDEDSLQPRWLEMVAIHPPKPLKELRMKMEFVEIDDDLFMSHLVTDGLAKILLLKREFHMEMRFDDISRVKNPIESTQ